VDKITAIKESLATHVCGVLSFIPVVGIIPAVYALANWRHVRLHFHQEWNPAGNYLRWGAILAIVGVLSTSVPAIGTVLIILINKYG
jgi:ABC-type phosphate transport system permease subunit